MTAIAGDPHALRASATTLSARSSDLLRAADTVRGQGLAAGSGWQGTAALRFAATAGQAVRTLGTTGDRLARVATATDRYAAELDSAQSRARGLQQRHDVAQRDLATKARAATGGGGVCVPDPRELESAADVVRALAGSLGGVVEAHAAAARRFRATLDGASPGPDVLGWLSGAWATARTVGKTIKLVRQAKSVASFLKHLNIARSALKQGDLLLRSHALQQAAGLVRTMVHGPLEGLAARPGLSFGIRLLGKAMPAVTVLRGLRDVTTGGGYTGWRGTTTRVLGGLAIGAGLLAMSPAMAVPPVAIGVVATLLVYNGWKLGNYAYDHRQQIRAAAQATYRVVTNTARALVAAHVEAFRRGVSFAKSYAEANRKLWHAGKRRIGLELEGEATLDPELARSLRRTHTSESGLRTLLAARPPVTLGPVPVRSGPADQVFRLWKRQRERCDAGLPWLRLPGGPLLDTAVPVVCTVARSGLR